MKNQIRSLRISVRMNKKEGSIANKNRNLFTNLLTIFPNLQYFNFDPSSNDHQYISFDNLPPNFISSTLRQLRVSVPTLNDCLYLLDGRFDQLQSLDLNISWIHPSTCLTSHRKVDWFPWKSTWFEWSSMCSRKIYLIWNVFHCIVLQRHLHMMNWFCHCYIECAI